MQRMIEICQILLPYCTDIEKEYGFWAEHDMIGFTVDYDKIPDDILNQLDKLGCHIDYMYNSLVIYV